MEIGLNFDQIQSFKWRPANAFNDTELGRMYQQMLNVIAKLVDEDLKSYCYIWVEAKIIL